MSYLALAEGLVNMLKCIWKTVSFSSWADRNNGALQSSNWYFFLFGIVVCSAKLRNINRNQKREESWIALAQKHGNKAKCKTIEPRLKSSHLDRKQNTQSEHKTTNKKKSRSNVKNNWFLIIDNISICSLEKEVKQDK